MFEMIGVRDLRTALRRQGYTTSTGSTRWHLRDVSGGKFFGYEYELVRQICTGYDCGPCWEDVEVVATSADAVYPDGKIGPVFNRGAVAELLGEDVAE